LKDLKKIEQFVMVIFLSSAQSVYFNQYFCLMCIYNLFLILDHIISYVEKNTKNQGSPMWCLRAPGHLQGPSRLSVGIGIAKRNGHQISSISCRFALWEVLSQTKYCCSLKFKIFGSKKIVRQLLTLK